MKSLIVFFLILFSYNFYFAQTFTSTVNTVIPDDNSVVSFDINVSGLAGSIDQNFGLEQVCLNIIHPYCSDLEVILQSPDGTQVILFSGVGGGGQNFTATCLDGISQNITAASPPFNGSFSSMGILGNLNNGQNPNGNWTLSIRDMGAVDIGTLVDWSISFGNSPALPFSFVSSNLPIVKLTTLGNAINNDLKVPVLMQIIDNADGTRNFTNQSNYAYEGKILTEWQGFSGPSYPKKNYDFQLVDNLDNVVDTSILGMTVEHDWIFKAEYLDLSLIKNTITYETSREMGNYAPNTRACEIILDGQYIGYYTLTEKIKRDKFRVDISKLDSLDTNGLNLTGGYIIEMNINGDPADWVSNYAASNSGTACCPVEYKHVYPKSDVILPVQHDYIKNYVDSFEFVLADPNFADPIQGYEKYIDVNSFIDFLITNEFSVNYDSYGRSTYMYKDKGTKLNYGPAWDFDRAMDYTNINSANGWVWEITHPYWPFPFHWQRLWEDETYRKKLACRWKTLRLSTLSDNSFSQKIDSLSTLLSEAANRNFTVWSSLGNQSYADQIDLLRTFLQTRLNWIDNTLALENVSLPNANFISDTSICKGSILDVSFMGDQYEFIWNGNYNSPGIEILSSGNYLFEIRDKFGCFTQKNIEIIAVEPDASFSFEQSNLDPFVWNFSPNNLNAISYQWSFGDGNLSSSQIAENRYLNSGNFTITLNVTDSMTCSKSETANLKFEIVDFNKQDGFAGNVFPNPFANYLQINLVDASENEVSLKLINELGQIISEKTFAKGIQNMLLETSKLAAGLYFVEMNLNNQIYNLKVEKN